MTLDFWHAIFQWGSIVLVILSFVFVAGSLWTGNLIQDREAARMLRLETELASAQTSLGGRSAADSSPAVPRESAAPRTLDTASRTTLLEALRQFNPEGPIEIRAVSGGGGDAGAFARALAEVIEEAGWTLAGEGGGSLSGTPPVGLLVRVASRGELPRRATALEDALNRAGLGARIERPADMREGVVELMVGLQP